MGDLYATGNCFDRGDLVDAEIQLHNIRNSLGTAVGNHLVGIGVATLCEIENIIARAAMDGDGRGVECGIGERTDVLNVYAARTGSNVDVLDAVHADGAAVRHRDNDVGRVRACGRHNICAPRRRCDGDRSGRARDVERVRAGAAVDGVFAVTLRVIDLVVAFLGENDVVAGATGNGVVTAGAAAFRGQLALMRSDVGKRVGARPLRAVAGQIVGRRECSGRSFERREHGPAGAGRICRSGQAR